MTNAKEEYIEYCVLCGQETGCFNNIPIDERCGYVGGAGQLCRECYEGLCMKGKIGNA